MQPVVIFRFSPTEGPAFFAEWLDARGIGYEIVALDTGARVPDDPRRYAGIGMMGGPMSVNDDLPWIEPLCALLRSAVAARVPVIGHCLGGQLLAKALGAAVTRTPVPEIGWIDVRVESEDARAWFGGRDAFTTFQWHYDAFALPERAVRLLTNRFNANQAYAIEGMHVGFQCHIEMTRKLVQLWCAQAADELPVTSSDARQSGIDIARDLAARIGALQAVASSVYERWSQGLRAPT